MIRTRPINGDSNDSDGTSRVKCMVTFHGVFEGLLGGESDGSAEETALSPDSDDHCPTHCSPMMQDCEILICHGVQDSTKHRGKCPVSCYSRANCVDLMLLYRIQGAFLTWSRCISLVATVHCFNDSVTLARYCSS
jgi:hypothetical protein